MKLSLNFLSLDTGANVVLASNISKQITLHFVDLPVNDYNKKSIESVIYLCRAGPDCVFCNQFKAFKENRIEKDAHTSTAIFSVIPVYDMDDGKKLKMAQLPFSFHRLALDSGIENSVLNIVRQEDSIKTEFQTKYVKKIDRVAEELPLIPDWNASYGKLEINDVERSVSVQDFQLQQLVRYGLCEYTIGYLEKRMEI